MTALIIGLSLVAVLAAVGLFVYMLHDNQRVRDQAERARRDQALVAKAAVDENIALASKIETINREAAERRFSSGELEELHGRTRSAWPPKP